MQRREARALPLASLNGLIPARATIVRHGTAQRDRPGLPARIDPVELRVDVSDEALVARVVQRDAAAFAALYDRYARRVYVLAAHLLGTAAAEEVVQELFLRLWQKAEQFDPARGQFRP